VKRNIFRSVEAQKYCSHACRTNAWRLRNKKKDKVKTIVAGQNEKAIEVEKMSLAGVGNAATGAAIVELTKIVLTKDENKPATKKDLNALKEILLGKRYFPILNMQRNKTGELPYFDINTNSVVFIKNTNKVLKQNNPFPAFSADLNIIQKS